MVLTMLAATVLCLVFAATTANDYDALLAEAVRARAEGRLEDALSSLRRAHAIQRSPGLRNNIARVLEELGRWREAVDEYRSVVGDPTADPELRELDDQRIAELAPKLLSAWVRFDVTPDSALVMLDGKPVPAQDGRDHATPAGTCFVESKLGGEIVLESLKVPAGARTTIKRDLSAPLADEAQLLVERSIEGLVIDRYRLRSPLEQVHTVRVKAGAHAIELDLADTTATASIALQLRPAQRFELASIIKTTPSEPAKEERAWVYFAGAGGVAAAALGGVLLALADASRDEIRDAETRDGVIYGLTRERAEEIESSARTRSGVGVVLIGAGAAAIAGALIGWTLD